jgi:hypothetical protein
MSAGPPQRQIGSQRKARPATRNEETDMTLDDYSYGLEYRTRTTELQDIAAMDRLAAELAPQSALRRYAASRTARTARGVRVADRWTDLWRRVRGGHLHHA